MWATSDCYGACLKRFYDSRLFCAVAALRWSVVKWSEVKWSEAVPVRPMNAYGGVAVELHLFFMSALDGGDLSFALRQLYPQENNPRRPPIQWSGVRTLHRPACRLGILLTELQSIFILWTIRKRTGPCGQLTVGQCQIGRYIYLPGSVRVGGTYRYRGTLGLKQTLPSNDQQAGRPTQPSIALKALKDVEPANNESYWPSAAAEWPDRHRITERNYL